MLQGLTARRLRYLNTAALFLTPALLFYALLIVYPLLQSLAFGFYKVDILGGEATYEFVGLANYRAVIDDAVFWKAATNTLVWATASPFLEIPAGLLLALYLQRGTRLSKFMRVLWFMPVLLPQIVVGIIWAWIYNSEWGALNQILRTLGLDGWVRAWLGHPDTALPALIVVTTWTWIGFNMIILLAAVASIPKDLIEAARLDGASRLQVLKRVIIPLITPVIVNLMVLCFIGKMKVFDLIWATTQGGPLWSTETVATYTVKRAFYWNTFEKGYPSAMATMWFVIILLISVLVTRVMQKRDALQY
jgi:multiple sugar transport system permease protein/raffinose/stachyose/melibiose transport system permease protein